MGWWCLVYSGMGGSCAIATSSDVASQSAHHMRKATPLAAFETPRLKLNGHLATLGEPALIVQELVGARLYTVRAPDTTPTHNPSPHTVDACPPLPLLMPHHRLPPSSTHMPALVHAVACVCTQGPMFVKYNGVLRGVSGTVPFLTAQMEKLCGTNRYVTTLHTINSAIVKMGKVMKAGNVYRGVRGGMLPDAFWTPSEFNVKGGIEFGFMSTTQVDPIAVRARTRIADASLTP